VTVKQLIAKLQKLPQSHRVIIEKSTGGECSASPIDAIQVGHYRADSAWAGDVKHPDDLAESDEPVVVLTPVN
jgi:hypothetical protein